MLIWRGRGIKKKSLKKFQILGLGLAWYLLTVRFGTGTAVEKKLTGTKKSSMQTAFLRLSERLLVEAFDGSRVSPPSCEGRNEKRSNLPPLTLNLKSIWLTTSLPPTAKLNSSPLTMSVCGMDLVSASRV